MVQRHEDDRIRRKITVLASAADFWPFMPFEPRQSATAVALPESDR